MFSHHWEMTLALLGNRPKGDQTQKYRTIMEIQPQIGGSLSGLETQPAIAHTGEQHGAPKEQHYYYQGLAQVEARQTLHW